MINFPYKFHLLKFHLFYISYCWTTVEISSLLLKEQQIQILCLWLCIVFQNIFCYRHEKKEMMQLQHLHLCWQQMDNLYPFILWYLELFWNTKHSPKPWGCCLENFQGINSMGLSAPLYDSYPNKCSETPSFHWNLDMTAL